MSLLAPDTSFWGQNQPFSIVVFLKDSLIKRKSNVPYSARVPEMYSPIRKIMPDSTISADN
jgi:hypothetical protein